MKQLLNLLGFILILLVFNQYGIRAQSIYQIDINKAEKEIIRGHLDLGGTNPAGEEIAVNSYFIEKDGKPFFPVIGEFHYARYPQEYWEEEILKMKSGGINVIASYVFWNLHERKEGQFDWSGDLNLRKFIELAHKHQIYTIVRMGPFCHGEMRNGGLPDWLYGREFEVRSNDPEYLEYVDVLYGQIAHQIEGLLYKDGGSIIGVQLENEYQHSAAPWEFTFPGSEKEYTVADLDAALAHEQITVTDGMNPRFEYGKKHMNHLKAMAKKHGVDVPIYTATGWGNATIVEKGSIPVTAGYAYPFWTDPHPSSFYLFKDIHKYPDYSPVSYNTDLYPSIPCEIGPGIQPKFSRRPIVAYESVNPLMVRIIGSGSNGIGYYMYHGGTTPQYDGKFYNEEVNGITRMNYDFQAPLGQYGQARYHYKHLRMLHMFLDAYNEKLAPMKTILPETNAAITPDNTETLRYAVRSYGESGFLFMINFQDHLEVKNMEDVSIQVKTAHKSISFPVKGSFDVPQAMSAIFPFNLKLEKATILSATVQPLSILHQSEGNYYVFSAIDGISPELNFAAETKISKINNARVENVGGIKSIKSKNDRPFSFEANGVQFMVLPQSMAINALKVNEELIISEAMVLDNQDQLQLITHQTANTFHVFPAREIEECSAHLKKGKAIFKGFASYAVSFDEFKPDIQFKKVSERKYTLSLHSDISQLNDVFVDIDYVGDRGLAFINGEMITDHLYQEKKWEIGLKSFASQLKEDKMVLIFHPMYSHYSYLEDLKSVPEFEDGKYLKVNGMDIVPEYKAEIRFKK